MTLVRSICNHLISQNFSALWICSDQNQSSRINTINKIKMNHCKVLVTTDLAARGIDVHKVNLVINLGLPCPPEIYIHRMGRAGRYGSEGAVVTILSEGEEMTTFTKMMSVISTDPIDLHVLPEQIDAIKSNLDVIRCLPAEGPISVDEFSFKLQMKDNQEKSVVKMQGDKKTKKKKKRKGTSASKLASQNGITDQLSSVNENNVEMANHAENNPVSNEMVNECIEQFSQSLADFLVAGELTPESNALKCLFGLQDDPATAENGFEFVQNPPDNLLTYALHIKQRNEFIDEQIVPCSVDEFVVLLNRSNCAFSRHSSGLSSLIREVCSKIERPVKQRLNASRSITSSDISSYDSEQSEISNQISNVGVTSLSQQLFQTVIDDDKKNISGRAVKQNNVHSWSGKFSRSNNLADEFSKAMITYGKETSSSSSKQSTSFNTSKSLLRSDLQSTTEKKMCPEQLFNNCKRLNSDAENKYPKEPDSSQAPVSADIYSQNTVEEHSISPNKFWSNLNHSNPSENETLVHDDVNESRIPADEAESTLSLSDQFSHAVINSTLLENGPRISSKMTSTSSTEFSTNQNHSYSIVTNDQPHRKSEKCIKEKHISQDFNLSDQFLNIISNSLVEADIQKPSESHKTPPSKSPDNFNRSGQRLNGTQSRNGISEKRVSTNYPSGITSLSDQFSASVNHCEYSSGKSTFDHEYQTKSNVLKNSENSLNADSLTHDSLHKTDVPSYKIVPKFADLKILAVHDRNGRNVSEPVVENCTLSNQFLSAFEGEKRLKTTPSIPNSSNQRSADSSSNRLSTSIPSFEVSDSSFKSVSKLKSQSNCISVPDHKKTAKSTSHLTHELELSLKSVLVPEMESNPNISPVLVMNNPCCSITTMKNSNGSSFSNEANEESSLISNFQQNINLNFEIPSDLKSNRVEFANYRSEYATEHSKNCGTTPATHKTENRLIQRFASDCQVVRDENCDGNVTNTAPKPSFKNFHLSENFKPNNSADPISSENVPPCSGALNSDFRNRSDRLNLHSVNQTAAILPSLRSYVSSQQEQKIWLRHLSFIRRQCVSKGRVTENQ